MDIIQQLEQEVAELREQLAPLDSHLAELQIRKDEFDTLKRGVAAEMRSVHDNRAPLCQAINARLAALMALKDIEPIHLGG